MYDLFEDYIKNPKRKFNMRTQFTSNTLLLCSISCLHNI